MENPRLPPKEAKQTLLQVLSNRGIVVKLTPPNVSILRNGKDAR